MNSETYRRWFEYEKDSHEKALTSTGTGHLNPVVRALVVSLWSDCLVVETDGRRTGGH